MYTNVTATHHCRRLRGGAGATPRQGGGGRRPGINNTQYVLIHYTIQYVLIHYTQIFQPLSIPQYSSTRHNEWCGCITAHAPMWYGYSDRPIVSSDDVEAASGLRFRKSHNRPLLPAADHHARRRRIRASPMSRPDERNTWRLILHFYFYFLLIPMSQPLCIVCILYTIQYNTY